MFIIFLVLSHIFVLQEQDNFYRMSTGILDYGTKCKRQLLEKHLKETNVSFKDFLKRHQHILYHLYFNRKCRCAKGCYLPRQRILHKEQLVILFERQSVNHLSQHTGTNYDFCCCDVQQNVKVKDLDLTLTNCILVNCCVELFWSCCLAGGTFESFLNAHRHDIFHLLEVNTQCSLCVPNYTFPVSKLKLYQNQWDTLYNYTVKDPGNAAAKTGIRTFHLDTELACTLLNILCPLKINVDKLRVLRNTMCGHVTEAEIDEKTFIKRWTELEGCLLHIARFCNTEKEMKVELHSLKKRSLDVGLCEEYRISLLTDIKRDTDNKQVNLLQVFPIIRV